MFRECFVVLTRCSDLIGAGCFVEVKGAVENKTLPAQKDVQRAFYQLDYLWPQKDFKVLKYFLMAEGPADYVWTKQKLPRCGVAWATGRVCSLFFSVCVKFVFTEDIGLKFERTKQRNEAHIRIAREFKSDKGFWSKLGRKALDEKDSHQPTMNVGTSVTDNPVDVCCCVVLHFDDHL